MSVLLTLAAMAYAVPATLVAVAAAIALQNSYSPGYRGTGAMAVQALGYALFWPGAMASHRIHSEGTEASYWWFVLAFAFYPGVLAEERGR